MPQVFIVLAITNADAIRDKVLESFPNGEHFIIDEDKFAVAFDGTTRDLAERVGIRSDPSIGSGIVFPVTNYSGRADPDLWEWMTAKLK